MTDDRLLAEGETIDELDSEIVRIRGVLRDLIDRRNQLAPIYWLFPELLCYIFHLSVFEDDLWQVIWDGIMSLYPNYSSLGTRQMYAPSRQAVLLTHVCRRWRAIAKEDTTLWTMPLMSSRRWCLEMLERSKEAPLTIFVDNEVDHAAPRGLSEDPTAIFSKTLQASLQQLYQVQTLVLMFESEVHYVAFASTLSLLVKPAPALTTLCIVIKHHGFFDEEHLFNIASFGDMPCLRRLMLDGSVVPLSSPLLRISSLTSLVISNMSRWKTFPLCELTNILENLKGLHLLAVRRSIPDTSRNDLVPRVSLPHLHTLILEDHLESCAALFLSISDIPTDTEINFTVLMVQVEPPDFMLLLSSLAPFCADSRTAIIDCQRSYRFSVEFFTDCPSCNGEISTRPRVSLTTNVTQDFPDNSPAHQFERLIVSASFRTLSFERIEYLGLREVGHYDPSVPLESLWDFFSSFSNVTTLTVDTFSLIPVLNIVQAGLDVSTIFPLLSFLAMDRVCVTSGIMDKLRQFLEVKSGTLRTIDLRDVTIRKRHITELENMIEVKLAPVEQKPGPNILSEFVGIVPEDNNEDLGDLTHLSSNKGPVPFDRQVEPDNWTNSFEPGEEDDLQD